MVSRRSPGQERAFQEKKCGRAYLHERGEQEGRELPFPELLLRVGTDFVKYGYYFIISTLQMRKLRQGESKTCL